MSETSEKRTCAWCGADISHMARWAKYCSAKCRISSSTQRRADRNAILMQARRSSKTCLECGEAFAPTSSDPDRQKYCSSKCRNRHYDKSRQKQITPKKINCAHCGARFSTVSKGKSRAELTKYCSIECRRLARNERARNTEVFRKCDECGKGYEAKAPNQRFCETQCKTRDKLKRKGDEIRARQREVAAERALSLLILPMQNPPENSQ